MADATRLISRLTIVVAAAGACIYLAVPAQAQRPLRYPYVFNVHMMPVKDFLNFAKTRIDSASSVIKARITWRANRPEGEDNPYEDLYYSQHRYLGLNRLAAYNVPAQELVAICVNGDQISAEDTAAAANAAANSCAHLVLDCFGHGNSPNLVRVPDGMYRGFVEAMRSYDFYVREEAPPEVPQRGLFTLDIEAETSPNRCQLWYYGRM